MKSEIHSTALVFVREKNCAMSTPLELVKEAMEIGSAIGQIHLAKREIKRLQRLHAGQSCDDGEKSGTLET